MNPLLDAFWRAAAYCLRPRVILLSLMPLLIAGGLSLGLGYLYWSPVVDGVRAALESWSLVAQLLQWLDAVGAAALHAMLAPLIVVTLAVPVIVIVSLLLVALWMTPALTRLVAARRFPMLERKRGGGVWSSLALGLGCTVVAMLALVASIPLWFVPPLVLVLPPLIWGWLTYRVMSFDVLAEHASAEERRTLLREHRWPLLAMGIIAGYLGAAPSLLWAFSAAMLVLAPVIIVGAIWLYTLVFAFSALWFAHFGLAALQALRRERDAVPPPTMPAPPALPPVGMPVLPPV